MEVKPADQALATNRFQEDFVYLKTLGEQVVPLEDHYFPPAKRAAMEREILTELAQPGCTREEFVLCIERYLAAFNNEHAHIQFDPRPATSSGEYPFKVHYVSNVLYLSDIAAPYDRSLIGQKITALNERPVADVEQRLLEYVSSENLCTKRASLDPSGYSDPDMARAIGLTSSITNQIKLEFAGHTPTSLAPVRDAKLKWQAPERRPNLVTAERPHPYDCRIFPEQNFAYFQFNSCFDKIAILDGLHMANPWLRPLVRLWLAIEFHRENPSALLDGFYDSERPILKDYMESTVRDLNRRSVTNLIIDLRYNGGGETELCDQLLYFLTSRTNLINSREYEYNLKVVDYFDRKEGREIRGWYAKTYGTAPPSGQLLETPDLEKPFFDSITDRTSVYHVAPDRPVYDGRIIVLANQDTHSAASLLAGQMQDNRLAVIVGTTTGNNPTGPTGMTPFRLPHSGIVISLPGEYDVRAVPSKGELLQPDYWVENSMADNENGRDAAFEKALDLLNAGPDDSYDRMMSAKDFLTGLKKSRRQPGWSSKDKGTLVVEDYSKAITFRCTKDGDPAVYRYVVDRESKNAPWKLQKAWMTNKRGRRLKDYITP